jgi:hypothetical protein
MSSLASARRTWRERTRRAVAREQGRCCLCQKKDKTGLMDGKCTACWVRVQNGPTATA